jgi:uncharacterized protein (TIGR02588 family)
MATHVPDPAQAGTETAPAPRPGAPGPPPARASIASRDREAAWHDLEVTQTSGAGPDEAGQHPGAEWFTLAISSLIVLSLIGLTSYYYLTRSTAPAVVEVEPRLADVRQAGGRFYLPVRVRNGGGETAEEIRVRVTATGPSGRQETAEFQVQFLAGGAADRAVVTFGSDPRQGQVEAAVVSYLEP